MLLAGTSDGTCWMWKLPSGDCKTFQGHSMRNSCGALMKDGRRVALAYEDGVIKVWDLKEGNPLISMAPPMGHSASVTSLAVHHEAVLLLSGSEDSTAKLINANSGKVGSTFVVLMQLLKISIMHLLGIGYLCSWLSKTRR